MNQRNNEFYITQILAYTCVGIMALLCFLPFMMVVSGSFSEESAIIKYGYSLLPRNFSLQAYDLIFRTPQKVFDAYMVSSTITVVGTLCSLFITAMTAYVLVRKDFKYRNYFAFMFYFTSIFSGGMIPSYILVVDYLNLKDNLLALILPPLLSAWNIFLMRNFMTSIPGTIAEAAKIDGANDLRIFLTLYLPLSTPGLATVGLFTGLGYWNDWFGAMLYIDKQSLYPLQYLLYRVLSSVKALQEAAMNTSIPVIEMPSESLKMAMAVVATGPIILLYPFVQKYFVKGLTVGAVKG